MEQLELERFGRFYLFTFLPFPYQALKCLMKFKVHAEGIALEAKVRIKLWHRFEVQAEVAVVLKGDRDVLAVEHLRIALHAPRQRLDERVVRIAVEKE